MAEHTGDFNWLKSKVLNGFIQFKSFAAYWTSDGSIVPQSQLPNDNSFVTRGMLNLAVGSIQVNPEPITYSIIAGTTPIPLTILYSLVGASASGVTTATDGTVTNQATVNVIGTGTGAKYTVTTASHAATTITQTAAGTGYNPGDTFTIAALPGITFTVTSVTTMQNPTLIFRNPDGSNYSTPDNTDTGSAIVITTPDRGDGLSADTFSVVIKP